jgi:MFS family permease
MKDDGLSGTLSPELGGEPAYPPARYAWYVVAVLTLANVSAFVDRQILSLLVIPMRRDLGISDTQVSLLMGLTFAIFYTALGLPIGRLADSRSRRGIIGVGVALWSLMTVLSGFARSYTHLLFARIGVGVGEAALGPPAVSLVSDYFPRERRATAMSVYSLGTFFGSGLAYFLGGLVVGMVAEQQLWVLPLIGEIRPWQTVFLVVGAPGILISLLFLTVSEPPRRGVRAGAAALPWSELWRYVRHNRRAFSLQSLGFGLSATVNYGIAAWLATFLVRTHDWTIARAGMVQGTLTMTVGVLGVITGGRIADWFVRRGHVDGPLRVGIIGAVGLLLSATIYPLVPSAALVVALLVPVNFFAAMPWGAASAAAAEIMPNQLRAQGTALYFLVVSLVSGSMGPTAVALVTDRVFGDDASLRYSLSIVSGIGMTATILLLGLALRHYKATLAYRDRWISERA